jgi:uncharacterized protein
MGRVLPSHRLSSRLLTLAFAVATLLFGVHAAAFVPPPIQGHVTDTAAELTAAERRTLEDQLEAVRRSNGNEIAVFILPSLGGETIEEVAYATFNAWKIGQKGVDNGVLLVIAPAERRVRIEVGKGAEGALTDVEAAHIIEQRIAPQLKQGHFKDAIEAGCDGIDRALRDGGVHGPVDARAAAVLDPLGPARPWVAGAGMALIAALQLALFARARRRHSSEGREPAAPSYPAILRGRTTEAAAGLRASIRFVASVGVVSVPVVVVFCMSVDVPTQLGFAVVLVAAASLLWSYYARNLGVGFAMGAVAFSLLCAAALWYPMWPWAALVAAAVSTFAFDVGLRRTRCASCKRLLARRVHRCRLEEDDLDALVAGNGLPGHVPAPVRTSIDELTRTRGAAGDFSAALQSLRSQGVSVRLESCVHCSASARSFVIPERDDPDSGGGSSYERHHHRSSGWGGSGGGGYSGGGGSSGGGGASGSY